MLINQGLSITQDNILEILQKDEMPNVVDANIAQIDLSYYDQLLTGALV